MRCVVLGGTGFLGLPIVSRLHSDGHEVRVLSRSHPSDSPQWGGATQIRFIQGDFLNKSDMSRALQGADVVVHLATTTDPRKSNDDPASDVRDNLLGSIRLLDLMVEHGVGKIVFASSGGTVYGEPIYQPVDEDHPTNPLVPYGITKLAFEKYLLLYERMHGIRAMILRISNPFGPGQRLDRPLGAVGIFLSRAILGLPIEIWGDGQVVRDYIYVEDVADAFSRSVNYMGSGSVFNVSTGVGTSLSDLLQMCERVLGRPVERRYFPARSFDVSSSVLSSSKITRLLGWSAQTTMMEGIARTSLWIESRLACPGQGNG